jgi:thiamine-monophosphate kinase
MKPTDAISLGLGAEFDAIRQMSDRWGARASGLGDDAAILRVPRGDSLVVSTDTAVEGRHFKRAWLSPRQIGYRSVVAALSDLAAMAARPIGVLVAVTVPDAWRGDLLEIADGIGDAVGIVRTHIVGGNLSAGTELSITTTVLGAAFAPLRRSGARLDDRVYVTGELGGPVEAVRRLSLRQMPDSFSDRFADRFARPVPRLAEARWLVERGATAGIDISDGLIADLRHVAAASQVAIDIDDRCLPVFDGADLTSALHGGDEYEIVVTAPHGIDHEEFQRCFGLRLSEIGRVVSAPETDVTVRGARVANAAGYDHFSH